MKNNKAIIEERRNSRNTRKIVLIYMADRSKMLQLDHIYLTRNFPFVLSAEKLLHIAIYRGVSNTNVIINCSQSIRRIIVSQANRFLRNTFCRLLHTWRFVITLFGVVRQNNENLSFVDLDIFELNHFTPHRSLWRSKWIIYYNV